MFIFPLLRNYASFALAVNILIKTMKKVTDYLNYLYKEIDLLFEHLNKNNIKLNVGTVFGGGSPTILSRRFKTS